MRVLVTGGAGYIGSHMVKLIGETTDWEITVVDNLSTGFEDSVLYGDLVVMDLAEVDRLETLFKERKFDAVIHFAASVVVPESVENPLKYYLNNTVNTIRLTELAVRYGVRYFVFSSTAAVYGNAEVEKVTEDTPVKPISPYGSSKLFAETAVLDAARAYEGFNAVALRYFNVAGASLDGKIGQKTKDATHLIKVVAEAAAGKRSGVMIFGTDYPTPDGTGVRDYIHVEDLVRAHLSVIDYLKRGGKPTVFNCGYGRGYSVREVIETMKRVSGRNFDVKEAPRREGDIASIMADNTKLLKLTDWRPMYDDLEVICKTAYEWERNLK